MTRVLPRKRYGQLTRLAGLLTYSVHRPSRQLRQWYYDSMNFYTSLQQRDCTGFTPVSLLIRISKGDFTRNKTAQK